MKKLKAILEAGYTVTSNKRKGRINLLVTDTSNNIEHYTDSKIKKCVNKAHKDIFGED